MQERHKKKQRRTLLIELRGKMNQTELAKALGIAQQTVSAIETGEMATPSIKIMKKYEIFFRRPMEELFSDVFEKIQLRGEDNAKATGTD